MAFKKQNSCSETFKIVIKNDDAVPESVTEEIYDNYLKNLDETVLGLVGEPTRFVMKRDLSFASQKHIASEQVGVDADGKPQVKMGYILEEIRSCLIDIENPSSLKPDEKIVFEKDKGDGLASKALIAYLHSLGVVMQLFSARQKVIAPVQKKM